MVNATYWTMTMTLNNGSTKIINGRATSTIKLRYMLTGQLISATGRGGNVHGVVIHLHDNMKR